MTGGVAWGADSAKVERQQDRQIEWGEQVCSSKSEQAQKKGRCCQAACLDFAAGMAKAHQLGVAFVCVLVRKGRHTGWKSCIAVAVNGEHVVVQRSGF